ncbi:MAG TPA: hypothetical protein VFV38_24705 [Ktedonobacteraceae bacterium]|nr:hypothetical protein [Ktedonobacteraceae bacterium]
MGEGLMPPCPKIVQGQQQLTPEQEAYARLFARKRIDAMLSTVTVDEQEAEEHLRAAYRAVRLKPPATICWFDSPLSFTRESGRSRMAASVWISVAVSVVASMGVSMGVNVFVCVMAGVMAGVVVGMIAGVVAGVAVGMIASIMAGVMMSVAANEDVSVVAVMWMSVVASVWAGVVAGIWAGLVVIMIMWVIASTSSNMRASVEENERASAWASMRVSAWVRSWTNVGGSVRASVKMSVEESLRVSVKMSMEESLMRSGMEISIPSEREIMRTSVGEIVRMSGRVETSMKEILWAGAKAGVKAGVEAGVKAGVEANVWASVIAYKEASYFAVCQFFHEVFEENKLIHLARFNELVSGYWLGRKEAWVVRKPVLLERDERGRLHNASGPCIQFRDGWGVYAWHGVIVPEQVIFHPEQLTREDWINQSNAEVRRAIQERLGNERFVEIVGKQIDAGRRGKLIEVDLGRYDPERVAHYVQVQDSSTERQYYLRVPPSITKADEAIAWTFGLDARDYQPGQET